MRRIWCVCCRAAADSCSVSCTAIVGGCVFSAAVPVLAGGGVLTCGRGGALRTVIRWLGKGGSSSRSSGTKSSGTLLVSAVRGGATGLTCTSAAQGIARRFLTLPPPNTHAPHQRQTLTDCTH